jgi:tetratricopeptide (TPR) repeat protein
MKFLHKYGTRSNEVRRARKELYFRIALLFAVILFFIGMVLITKFRPRLDKAEAAKLPEVANVGDPLKNPALIRLRAEVETLKSGFLEKAAAAAIDEESLEMLEEAIATQREVIRMRGSEIAPKADLDQLEDLLSLYDEEMGRFLIAQSTRLEDNATAHFEARQYDQALDNLQRAKNLQEEVNAQYPRSTFRSSTRLHQLNNKLMAWTTKPVADKADSLKETAFSLMENGRYAEARDKIQQALETQQSLNETSRGSRFATIARLRQFEEAWKTIQTAEEVNRVERLIEEARGALSTEQIELAIAKAEEAEAIQQSLFERFPEQRRTDSARIEEIQTLKDTAASLPSYMGIQKMRTEVRSLLRNRKMDAFKNTISEWLRATRNFTRNYPRSEYTGLIDDEEVTFLHEKRDEIPTLLETVYGNLAAIPGMRDQFLYRTEVAQILYSRVMGENPSSIKGNQLPVESVTWNEANQFVQKLSWILARPVDLPSREMFLSVLGETDEALIREQAWSSQNTDRETRPVGSSTPNAKGFYDLLGNVSEWLRPDEGARPERVLAIGGSARDSFLRLATVPEESRSPTERNRFVGFRITVQMGD